MEKKLVKEKVRAELRKERRQAALADPDNFKDHLIQEDMPWWHKDGARLARKKRAQAKYENAF